ncbi:MFS transporter [Petrotoga sp. 9PW.55.5.1]|uniref:MFS transporter n=1 Tax=Petrotoga sp. 9PW.55.5.1 TaxID=1308979 RepID=UPI0018F693EA|nr:MFS transporter [Petrotoga sp. 9PW.55.5.1]
MSKERIHRRDKISTINSISYRKTHPFPYALGMLGITIPGQMIGAYLVFFYNDVLGISLTMISLITVFATIWDAINDPLFGYFSDRTRTKIGRRKPWMLISVPLYCISYIFLFSPPLSVRKVFLLVVYFAIFSMFTETLSTIASVNYHSLFPELFIDSKIRTRSNALRQAFQFVGLIVGVTLAPILIERYGYSITATFMILIGMFFYLIAVFSIHERPEYIESEAPTLKESLKAVMANKNFWAVSLTNFFYQASLAILLLSIPYFIKYTLGLSEANAAYLTGAVFITAIPAMYLWVKVIDKLGALTAWRTSLLFLGIAVIPIFSAKSLVFSMIAGVLIGVGIAGVTANIDLIYAKVIDADAKASNLRREGIYFSGFQFIIHFSGLAKSLVLLLVTLIFGFVDGNNPGEHPDLAARFMISVFPALLMAVSFIISFFVRFKEEKQA